MKRILLLSGLLVLFMTSCENPVAVQEQARERASFDVAEKKGPVEETAGNNLSYPVIWAEGKQKTLPGSAGMNPSLDGDWWYWWGMEGTDPDIFPLSCRPDPDDEGLCDDGIALQATGDSPGSGWVKAYLQKDDLNLWQAGSVNANGKLQVHWIDWGDNLESVDWYTRSQVRTEVVLFQDLAAPMLEYEMRHVSGWGIDEVHGLATAADDTPILGPGTRATVYSACARLTIQKLLVTREDVPEGALEWMPQEGWTGIDTLGNSLVNPPIFNQAVYLGEDGPGYYSAEINVKGRIIYGYTWDVRKLNDAIVNGGEAEGDYRTTFSFDETCGDVALNTFFVEGVTEIMVPLEEEEIVITSSEDDGGGAAGQLDFSNNLTYIDIRILPRSGGGRRK